VSEFRKTLTMILLTVDNKNVNTTRRDTRNVHKMDMVISQSHDRLVVIGSVRRRSDIGPRNRSTLSRFERLHVEEPRFARRQTI